MPELSSSSSALVVVDIKGDRIDDFLKVMERDAKGSRDKSQDPGCIRFDFLHSRDTPNRYYFFEIFTDDEGAVLHKASVHYKAWADFKASGGVEKQEVLKLESASIPGGWALQANDAPHSRAGSCVFVHVEIKPDRIDDFFKAMEVDVRKSRIRGLDPGCLRFDLLRGKDDPNRFLFYEAYTNDGAAAYHKTTDHYKAWADFKATGGVAKQDVWKVEASSIPGMWAFQAASVKAGLVEMPLLGFGTYKVGAVPASASAATDVEPPPPSGPEVCSQIIRDAVASGYALLDCAQFYMNESWIGPALKSTIEHRPSLVITSKVWNNSTYEGPEAVKRQVDKSCDDLQCESIDLFLVHWPIPGKHVAAYQALRECKAAGKIKEIGVSNYCIEDYEELRAAGCFGENGEDKPVCNQIEVNPLLFRKKTIDFFTQEGVHIQAYRGLMQGPKSWGHPVLQEVCQEVGRPAPQVLGRFLVQQGISHVPKASTPDRMEENADLFSFDLSAKQLESLSGLTTAEALENFKQLYTKCIWRDTPEAGGPLPGERTLD